MTARAIDVFLLPGEHFAGDAHHRIRTLLGSCVSITLWHPRRRIGAMCHFVLAGAERPRNDKGLNGRYAEDALTLMLADLAAQGVTPGECQAKVFGGGVMFRPEHGRKLADVGRRNGELAKQLLHQHGIPIVSESLFDAGYRQIDFHVSSGEVWVRHAKPAELAALERRS